MARVRRSGDYIITWNSAARKIVIMPRRAGKRLTPFFGLGNAKIRIKIDNPPKKVVQAITGDSNSAALLPNKPTYLMGDWIISAGNMITQQKQIPKTNSDGSTTYYTMRYSEMANFIGYEMKNDVDLIANGAGESGVARSFGRVMW